MGCLMADGNTGDSHTVKPGADQAGSGHAPAPDVTTAKLQADTQHKPGDAPAVKDSIQTGDKALNNKVADRVAQLKKIVDTECATAVGQSNHIKQTDVAQLLQSARNDRNALAKDLGLDPDRVGVRPQLPTLAPALLIVAWPPSWLSWPKSRQMLINTNFGKMHQPTHACSTLPLKRRD